MGLCEREKTGNDNDKRATAKADSRMRSFHYTAEAEARRVSVPPANLQRALGRSQTCTTWKGGDTLPMMGAMQCQEIIPEEPRPKDGRLRTNPFKMCLEGSVGVVVA